MAERGRPTGLTLADIKRAKAKLIKCQSFQFYGTEEQLAHFRAVDAKVLELIRRIDGGIQGLKDLAQTRGE